MDYPFEMDNPFRIVAWNCRGASLKSAAWTYLLELDPDVALLQEVTAVPASVLGAYAWAGAPAVKLSGLPQRFQTGVLVKGDIVGDVALPAPNGWVARELEFFRGNFVAKQLRLRGGFVLEPVMDLVRRG